MHSCYVFTSRQNFFWGEGYTGMLPICTYVYPVSNFLVKSLDASAVY